MHFRELCSTRISSGCATPGPLAAPSTRPVCQNGAEEDIRADNEGGWTSPLGECIYREGCGSSRARPSLAMLAGRSMAMGRGRQAPCLQPRPGAAGTAAGRTGQVTICFLP